MRVGVVYHPRFGKGCEKFVFVADALRAEGHDVTHCQTNAEVEAADERCDVMLFEQRNPASICLADFIRRCQKPHNGYWIQWQFDLAVFDDSLPIEKQPGIEPYIDVMRGMDLVLVKERDRLDEYFAAGVKAKWFDQACPSSMAQAVLKADPELDVILWGSAARPLWGQRWRDAETLVKAGFKVAWATTDGNLPDGIYRLPGCQPLELPSLIERAKVVLCVDARQDIPGYWSDRIWLAAGAGACIVRRFGSVDGHGGGNLPAMGYGSDAMLISAVRELCDSFDKRIRYGDFARRMTFANNLYEHRVRELMNYAHGQTHKGHENPDVPSVFRQEDYRPEDARWESQEDAVPVLH